MLVLLSLTLCSNPPEIQAQPHLDTLRKYVPTPEVGDNRGPYDPVVRALHYMGFDRGKPYCAATISLCLEVSEAEHPDTRTALATDFAKYNEFIPAVKVLRGRAKAMPGDIVVWRRGNGYHGHAGFVDSVWTGRCGWTVEANTLPGDYNEKFERDGIYRRRRCIYPSAHTSIVAFVRTEP